jgi:hypothetical protein
MVEPLLFGEIEIGPSNQMHPNLPGRAQMPSMPGYGRRINQCPLSLRKRTCAMQLGMSALGQ